MQRLGIAVGTTALVAFTASLSACADTTEPAKADETTTVYEERGPACDPNYTGCVPDVPYDLDCADIGQSVEVIGSDPHGFDADGDGDGCETYG